MTAGAGSTLRSCAPTRLLASWPPAGQCEDCHIRNSAVVTLAAGEHLDQEAVQAEAAFDGCYVVYTDLPAERMTKEEGVASYKKLSLVEEAFRNLKTVWPIFDSLKNWIVDIQGVTKDQNGLGTTFSSPVVL